MHIPFWICLFLAAAGHPVRAVSDTVSAGKTEKMAVLAIELDIQEAMEKVLIHLTGYQMPKVFTIEGEKPRVVVDVQNASPWKGQSPVPVKGKMIQSVRVFFHKENDLLRIVLDLSPAMDHSVERTFFAKEKIYCIQVTEAR